MTQEDKQLLLIDLCARLPYNPHVRIKDGDVDLDTDAVLNGTYIHEWITFPSCQNITIAPYLRPMSSMTEEEESKYNLIQGLLHWTVEDGMIQNYGDAIDWLNENHFDYRGLIEKGLALEAKEGMYKTE